MKNLILSCAIICAAAFAGINQSFAQGKQPRLGIKAGADMMSITSATFGDVTANFDYHVGFQGGVFAEFPLSKQFSVTPQLLFSQKGGNQKIASSGLGNVSTGTQYRTNYLDIPVLFAFTPQANFSFYAGPQVALLTSQKTTYTATIAGTSQKLSNTSTEGFRKAAIGGNVGVGYHVNDHVGINLSYIFDFQKMVKDNSGIDKGGKNEGFALTIGYLF